MTTNELAAVSNILESANERIAQQVGESQTVLLSVQSWIVGAGVTFFFSLVSALVILIVGSIAIRVGVNILNRTLKKGRKANRLLTAFVSSAAKNTGWALLILIVLQRIGVNIAPLIAGLGVTGFILGFAFQESLGNLASGMMIAINEPFKVGDYVSMGGMEGTVKELNMMAATLATSDNKRVIVPNKVIWGAPITNFTAMDTRRLDIPVGIAYGADIAQAKAVAMAVQKEHPELKQDPAPIVVVAGLGDSSVNLLVRQWVPTSDYWRLLFAMTQEIKEAYDRNGISIAFPQLDVHIKNPEIRSQNSEVSRPDEATAKNDEGNVA